MHRRPLRLIATAAVGLVLLAGCGGDDDEPEVVGESGTTESTTTTAADEGTTESTAPDSSDGGEGTGGVDAEAEDVTWQLNAVEFRGQDGLRVAYDCPANEEGTTYTVWGTDTYTDDSSVCMAAVHAGLITRGDGGRVVIEIAPGQEEYTGSEANGVTSVDYGSWDGSFTFPQA